MEESQSTKANITIKNGEQVGSGGFSLAEKLKNKWTAHVNKNKAKAAARKDGSPEKEQKNDEIQDIFENFDPKKDKKKLTKEVRKKIVEAEKLYTEGVTSIRDLVAPTSVKMNMQDMQINGMYVRSFYVYNYPRFLESNWLSQIINFDVTLDLSIYVYPTETDKIMKNLRRKVAEMMSTKRIDEKRGVVADVGLSTSLEDAEQLRQDLQRGIERFFQVGLYFTIYADDKEKLNAASKQLETLLGGQLVMTRRADFQVERAFDTNLPQCTDSLGVVRNMNTSPLSTTFPFVSHSLTSNEGILYGLNRHNNSLIIFDRFKMENANQVVFAKSGAGKSYAVKLDILRSLMLGTDVIVLDPENEYENLTHTVGGTYINISLNSEQRINPFDLPLPIHTDDAKPGELLRENVINLIGLMSLMLGSLTPTEEALLDRAILQSYELKGITSSTPNPTDYEMPTMVDLKNILESLQGGENMAIRLEKYTEGTFSGLFSNQTNVNLNNSLVTFCIRDLEDKLRPISMYILLNFIWNKVRSDLKKRQLVIDEAWNVVQHEDSGRFLHGLVKRARKYYLGVTTITQDVEDFLDSPWGKPIITNSSIQMLLKQSPIAAEKLQKVFNITEGEKSLLLNSGVGQGLFFAGQQHVAIQIIASYGENKIVTTNPEEILEQRAEDA